MKSKSISYLILFFLSIMNLRSQNVMVECNNVMVQSVMEDIFSPPVASRIHLYSNVAAYEVFCKKNRALKPISFFSHLPKVPNPSTNIDYDIAAVVAFVQAGKKFIYTETQLDEFLKMKKMIWMKNIKPQLLNNSIEYGEIVANHVIEWSKDDNYDYTRTLFRYKLSDTLGAWLPTPPEYMDGMEPNWPMIRQVMLPKDSFFRFITHDFYDEDKNSACYKHMNEVYQKALTLKPEEKDIAIYWDDNPATTISKGHAMFVEKKPSPEGHWLKMTGQAINEKGLSMDQAAAVYATVSVAAFDAFINCWNAKYSLNTIRPETYIQRNMDPDFKPAIESPPFPEYPSGHSTVSAATATVLDYFFPNYHYTDSSQIMLGMKPRSFKSFPEAANEASNSRFLGGIHINPALREGERMGKLIGRMALSKFGKTK